MANRVAMWRILTSVLCARFCNRRPKPQGIQNVAPRLIVHIEARTDGTQSLTPGEKDRRGIVDHCSFERLGAGFVLIISSRLIDRVEGRIYHRRLVMPPVVRTV